MTRDPDHPVSAVQIGRPWYGGEVWIRDRQDETSPILSFTDEDWRAFVAEVKAGRYDIP